MMAPESVGRSGGVEQAKAMRVRTTLAVGLLVLGAGDLAAIDISLLPRYLAVHAQAAAVEVATLPARPNAPAATGQLGVDAGTDAGQDEAVAAEPPAVAAIAPPAVEPESLPPAWPHLLFDTGSAGLSAESQQTLNEVGQQLKRHAKARVVLGGHADDLGTDGINLALSRARAVRAQGWLIARGVRPNQIEIHSFGAGRPAAPGRTEEARARNRRVEITFRERIH